MLRRSAAELAALREIAVLIAAEAAPEWLPNFLGHCKDGPLGISRMVAFMEPTPTHLRRTLKQLRKAAQTIVIEMNSPITGELLGAPSAGIISDEQLQNGLEDFSKRAARADRHILVSTPNGHTKRGPGRVRPPGRLPPRVVCALVIAETWLYFRGKALRQPARKLRRSQRCIGGWREATLTMRETSRWLDGSPALSQSYGKKSNPSDCQRS